MPKRNKVTISFSLPIDSINCFEKLAKAEKEIEEMILKIKGN